MKNKILLGFIIYMLIFPLISDAQSWRSGRWKKTRYELFFGLGATNLLGELGGADRIGTNFVRDLEVAMTRPLASLGMRYRLFEPVSIKGAFTYGLLHGDDKLTKEPARQNRNLRFRSPIVEFSALAEYSLIKERIGHRYNLRKVRGVKGFQTNTYFFTGFCVFYFNPKGKYEGKWYPLQPLGTEGQGLVPTRHKYSRVQISIPLGIGFKYRIDRLWNIGIEYGVRKTFTDYLDDVSTTYYDKELIKAAHGEKGDMAAYLSNPALVQPGSDDPRGGWTQPNQQRGDSFDKDSYMFVIINLTYKLQTTRKGLPKF